MSRPLCVNIVPMLYLNQNPNVATVLSQHWPTLANFETTFRQCCVNVVTASLSTLGTDIETMFRQRCVNVAWTLVPNIGDRRWDNIQATLCECQGSHYPGKPWKARDLVGLLSRPWNARESMIPPGKNALCPWKPTVVDCYINSWKSG